MAADPSGQGAGPARHDFKSQVDATRADVERGLHEARAQFDQAKAQFDQVSEALERRTGRNLIFAVGIGIGIGLVLVASIIFITDIFMVVATVVVALGAFELATALRLTGRRVARIPTVVSALAIGASAFYLGPQARWIVLLGGIALVVVWRLVEQAIPRVRRESGELVRDLTAAILVQAYVSLLGSFAVQLAAPRFTDGKWWMLAFLIIVVATDTGAYAGGLSFGRHPMAPTISPNKTWEGLAGAAIAANLAGVLLAVFMLHAAWWFGLVYGSVLLVTATLGDLAESLIKRDIGVKDMSSWLPGHGGFLDRLDSMLPSAAAAFAMYLIFFPIVG